MADLGGGKGRPHVTGVPGAHLVGQPCRCIGFMDHNGYPQRLRRKIHRSANVASHTHQDVGLGVQQDLLSRGDRTAHSQRQLYQIHRRLARQRDPLNKDQLMSGGRN